jgi:hypothetical protein
MIPSTNRNSSYFNTETAKNQKFQLIKQDYRQAAQSGSLLCLTARISAKFKD